MPITLCRLCWLNTRSTASTSGEVASTRSRTRLAITRSRSGRGAEAGRDDDLDVAQGQRAARGALDQAQPAPGQARVDTEYEHATSRIRTGVRTLAGKADADQGDTLWPLAGGRARALPTPHATGSLGSHRMADHLGEALARCTR